MNSDKPSVLRPLIDGSYRSEDIISLTISWRLLPLQLPRLRTDNGSMAL